MQNPFVYGEVVPGESFVDREAELDRLIGDLSAGQKVFLISPRRYGKSSLIRQALKALSRRGVLTVEVTVSSYSSYLAFLEGYARALAAVETRWERARGWLTKVISSTRPEVRYDADATGPGRFSVAFPLVKNERDVNRLANEVFTLPGPAGGRAEADGRRRPRRVSGDRRVQRRQRRARAEGRGAAAAPGRLRVRRIRTEPDGEDDRPEASVLQGGAGDAPAEDSRRRLRRRSSRRRFAKSGIRAEAGLGAAIVDLAGNLPYDVQRLAHETWDDVRSAGGRTGDARHPAHHARHGCSRSRRRSSRPSGSD